MPTTSGPSSVLDALAEVEADAGDVEDALGDDRAAHQGAESMPRKVTTGISELRSTWTPTTRRRGRPLAWRCARSRRGGSPPTEVRVSRSAVASESEPSTMPGSSSA